MATADEVSLQLLVLLFLTSTVYTSYYQPDYGYGGYYGWPPPPRSYGYGTQSRNPCDSVDCHGGRCRQEGPYTVCDDCPEDRAGSSCQKSVADENKSCKDAGYERVLLADSMSMRRDLFYCIGRWCDEGSGCVRSPKGQWICCVGDSPCKSCPYGETCIETKDGHRCVGRGCEDCTEYQYCAESPLQQNEYVADAPNPIKNYECRGCPEPCKDNEKCVSTIYYDHNRGYYSVYECVFDGCGNTCGDNEECKEVSPPCGPAPDCKAIKSSDPDAECIIPDCKPEYACVDKCGGCPEEQVCKLIPCDGRDFECQYLRSYYHRPECVVSECRKEYRCEDKCPGGCPEGQICVEEDYTCNEGPMCDPRYTCKPAPTKPEPPTTTSEPSPSPPARTPTPYPPSCPEPCGKGFRCEITVPRCPTRRPCNVDPIAQCQPIFYLLQGNPRPGCPVPKERYDLSSQKCRRDKRRFQRCRKDSDCNDRPGTQCCPNGCANRKMCMPMPVNNLENP